MVFDLHNDLLTFHTDNALSEKLGEYTCADSDNYITLAVWTSKLQNPIDFITNSLKATSLIDSNSRLRYAIEDLHFLDASNMNALRSWKQSYNLLYAGLTWNYGNPLAAGAGADGGLSPLGKLAIRALEEASILLDTAHLNRQSFWEAIEYSKKRVINSHCCFLGATKKDKAFFSKSALTIIENRNITDDQITAIIERNGIIGLTFVPDFLGKNPASIEDIFEQIDYFCQRFSYKHLAIGTDFFGSSEYPKDLTDYEGFDKLEYIMKGHGYSQKHVDSVFALNAQELFQQA